MSESEIALNIIGSLILYCSCTLASAAGIGGGGLSVLLVIFNYGFGRGVVLSLWAILGNVLAQSSLIYNAHHPLDRTRPLIYWDVVFIALPAKLFGSTVGVLVSTSAPSDILAILAIFALCFVAAVVWRKYADFVALEHAASKAMGDEVSDISPTVNINRAMMSVTLHCEPSPLRPPNGTLDTTGEFSTPSSPNKPTLPRPAVPLIVPWRVIGALCGTWVCYNVSFSLLTLVEKCSTSYFIIAAVCYPTLIVTMFVRLFVLIKKQEAKPSSPAEASTAAVMLEGDVVWRLWKLKMPVGSVLVGVVSALLGIDSGELIMPVFLSMGLLPQVAGATTTILSLFVTTATLFEYGVRRELQISYALWFFAIGVAGGVTGRKLILHGGRSSRIISALVGVLCLDVILLVVYLFTHNDPDYEFHKFCT